MTAAFVGCADDHPYVLRIHAANDAECDEYEPLLEDAIWFWSDHGIDAFVHDGCRVEEYGRDPTVFWPAEDVRAYTDDLDGAPDHVPVYVVDSITLDQAGAISQPRGATLVADVVACPRLVATDLPLSQLLAHELGHLLWLHHVDSAENVMRPSGWPQDIEDVLVDGDQLDEAQSNYDLCQKKMR